MASKNVVRTRWDRVRSFTYLIPDPHPGAKTQQQFKDECDMNRIVKNAMRGIQPRFLAQGVPQYGDFSKVPDLAGAYELIERAQEAFMNLPAELRAELHNDPARLQHITREQAEKYKLTKPKPAGSEAEAAPSAAASQPPQAASGKKPKAPATPPAGEE